MTSLVLVRPSMEYLDEIRSYRQEVLDHGGDFHGDSGLHEFEDISAWIEHCRLLEHKETIPFPVAVCLNVLPTRTVRNRSGTG